MQNPTWQHKGRKSWRQETSALGFRASLADEIFGWWKKGGKGQEAHVTEYVHRLRRASCRKSAHGKCPICELPPLRVLPVREGSTGIFRDSI